MNLSYFIIIHQDYRVAIINLIKFLTFVLVVFVYLNLKELSLDFGFKGYYFHSLSYLFNLINFI